MALYGSSVPIEGLPNGAMAVLVICPNAYSHSRLMQSLQNIVPDAGQAIPADLAPAINAGPGEVIPVSAETMQWIRETGWQPPRDPEQDDDEGLPADFTQCRIGGGCE